MFATPAASLALRSKYFGLTNPRSEPALAALNHKLWVLQRVVLHPTYRGAGVAGPFVRRACELCSVDWVEALSVLGRVNPFFERAGFVRVGTVRKRPGGTRAVAYGSRQRGTVPTADHGEPVYYVFDNRGRA